ncbi:hypothetical protein ACFYY8_31760 [Streptosporangium sp. NPDC001559]|uniref:hypothetical protein n=1 Tax=Streptosporangium sp. NPDC001559 TaxID=3366187 RepID=UPI0036EA2A2D
MSFMRVAAIVIGAGVIAGGALPASAYAASIPLSAVADPGTCARVGEPSPSHDFKLVFPVYNRCGSKIKVRLTDGRGHKSSCIGIPPHATQAIHLNTSSSYAYTVNC